MPNQNDPIQNPNPVNPVSPPPVPPSIFPQSDLPPIPSVFSTTPVATPIDTQAGSSAPPSFSSVTSKPKKKFGGGKIIATILGLVLLIGGVGAGIMLTQQKQLINQKAQTPYQCSNAGSVESCYGKSAEQPCTGGVGTCKQNTSGLGCYCDTGGGGGGGSGGGGVVCSGNTCSVGDLYNQSSCYVVHFGCNNIVTNYGCNDWIITGEDKVKSATFNQTCGGEQIDVVGCGYCEVGNPNCTNPNPYISTGHTNACNGQPTAIPTTQPTSNPTASPSPTPTATPTHSPTPTPTATPTHSPTPTPTPHADCYTCNQGYQCVFDAGCQMTGQRCSETQPCPAAPSCIAVKTYSSTWTFIDQPQLPSLKAGDVVNFCVSGGASSGTFDRARFMINTILKAETTDPRPGTNDICQTYTILSTDTTIDVRAKIHHSTGGWFGESI